MQRSGVWGWETGRSPGHATEVTPHACSAADYDSKEYNAITSMIRLLARRRLIISCRIFGQIFFIGIFSTKYLTENPHKDI
jgi:hypothetical protein